MEANIFEAAKTYLDAKHIPYKKFCLWHNKDIEWIDINNGRHYILYETWKGKDG